MPEEIQHCAGMLYALQEVLKSLKWMTSREKLLFSCWTLRHTFCNLVLHKKCGFIFKEREKAIKKGKELDKGQLQKS